MWRRPMILCEDMWLIAQRTNIKVDEACGLTNNLHLRGNNEN